MTRRFRSQQTGAGWPGASPRWLWAVYALFVIAQDLDWVASEARLTQHGSYGMNAVPVLEFGPRTGRVVSIEPGGPGARAGIAVGDLGQVKQVVLKRSIPAVGDRMELELIHGGGRRTVTLTAEPSREPAQTGDPFAMAVFALSCASAAALGLLILLRSRGQPLPILLGWGLAAFGLAWELLGPIFSAPWLAPLAATQGRMNPTLQYCAFLAFALVILDEVDGGRRWRWGAFAAYAVAQTGLTLLFVIQPFYLGGFSSLLAMAGASGVLALAGLAGTLLCLLVAWWTSQATQRSRIGLITLAFGCILANQIYIAAMGLEYKFLTNDHIGDWPVYVVDFLAGVAAPLLFAYAILRHRVLDLGFAVNRTLVYSIVSAILLAAFGLIEWGVDHFVKIEGREQNALIDAAIALVVYLGFHRVTGFVEHAVEALFFRRWQEKETELRRFVADAAFIGRREVLLGGFAETLRRFADRDGGGGLSEGRRRIRLPRLAGGGGEAPRLIDDDDPALVRLRADRKPVTTAGTGSTLSAELASARCSTGAKLAGARADGRARGGCRLPARRRPGAAGAGRPCRSASTCMPWRSSNFRRRSPAWKTVWKAPGWRPSRPRRTPRP